MSLLKEYTSQSPNTPPPPPPPPEAPPIDISQSHIDGLVTGIVEEAVAYRKASGLTLGGMADTLHVTPSTVSALERGRRQPNLNNFMRYITALGGRIVLQFPDSEDDLYEKEE